MKYKLVSNWFLKQPIDLEHKQYILLDYLQKVDKNINIGLLHREFDELDFHYRAIINYRKSNNTKFSKIELDEINLICDWAFELLIDYRYRLKADISFINSIFKITNFNLNGDSVVNILLQKNNCEIYEHFVFDSLNNTITKKTFTKNIHKFDDTDFLIINSNFSNFDFRSLLSFSQYNISKLSKKQKASLLI